MSVGATALASIFSKDNLSMDDSLMEKYKEFLQTMSDKASGFESEKDEGKQ